MTSKRTSNFNFEQKRPVDRDEPGVARNPSVHVNLNVNVVEEEDERRESVSGEDTSKVKKRTKRTKLVLVNDDSQSEDETNTRSPLSTNENDENLGAPGSPVPSENENSAVGAPPSLSSVENDGSPREAPISPLPSLTSCENDENILGEGELSPLAGTYSPLSNMGGFSLNAQDDGSADDGSPFLTSTTDENPVDLGGLVLNSEENGRGSQSTSLSANGQGLERSLALEDLEEIQATDEEPTWRALDRPLPERKLNNGDEFVEVHVIGRNSDQTVMSLSEGTSQRQIVFCPSTNSGMLAWLMSGLTNFVPTPQVRNEQKKDEPADST